MTSPPLSQLTHRERQLLSRERLVGVPQILDDVHRRFATCGDYEPDALGAEANSYHISQAMAEIRRRHALGLVGQHPRLAGAIGDCLTAGQEGGDDDDDF